MSNSPSAISVLASLQIEPIASLGSARAAFVGCGDSLAAARPAERLGHRILSAGDIAWSGEMPAGADVVVALSLSGSTGATVKAAHYARAAGMPLVAITSNPNSPLAQTAQTVVQLPSFDHREDVPALGYALNSLVIQAMVGLQPEIPASLALLWSAANESATAIAAAFETSTPSSMTFASMPDGRGAAEFWSLKFIEATGIAVRTAALEEIGHVDYFVGPQSHTTVIFTSVRDAERAETLGSALVRNGQNVIYVPIDGYADNHFTRELIAGLVGAHVSDLASRKWNRPHFRGGEVDMSARHIQVADTSAN